MLPDKEVIKVCFLENIFIPSSYLVEYQLMCVIIDLSQVLQIQLEAVSRSRNCFLDGFIRVIKQTASINPGRSEIVVSVSRFWGLKGSPVNFQVFFLGQFASVCQQLGTSSGPAEPCPFTPIYIILGSSKSGRSLFQDTQL